MRILCFALWLFSQSIFAQSEKSNFIGIGLNYNTLDLFVSPNFSKKNQRFEGKLDLGMGVNRTVFQKRFFPMLGLSATYNLVDQSWVKFGPTLNYQLSTLRVNAAASKNDFYNQFNLGYTFCLGKRVQVCQSTFFGSQIHRYYSAYLQDYKSITAWKFSLQIGLRYAL